MNSIKHIILISFFWNPYNCNKVKYLPPISAQHLCPQNICKRQYRLKNSAGGTHLSRRCHLLHSLKPDSGSQIKAKNDFKQILFVCTYHWQHIVLTETGFFAYQLGVALHSYNRD